MYCEFIDKDVRLDESPFVISIPIKWNEGLFSINGEAIVSTWSDDIILFADRKSAVKFKKIVSNMKDYFPRDIQKMREFFMEFSSPTEWENLSKVIKSIPLHKLYKD